MKEDTKVILLIVFFFLGFSASSFSANGLLVFRYFEAGTILATLGAAFFGARYAFSLQNSQEAKRVLLERVEAGNHALFQLARTYQYFNSIRREYRNLEDSPDRDLLIRPFIGIAGFSLEFDFRELAFLYRSGNPNILNELAAYQAQVASTLDVIYQRSEIHKQYAQPANEMVFVEHRLNWDPRKVKDRMGVNQSINLKKATDAMIDSIRDVMEGALELAPELRRILIKECPHQPFFRYLPNE